MAKEDIEQATYRCRYRMVDEATKLEVCFQDGEDCNSSPLNCRFSSDALDLRTQRSPITTPRRRFPYC